MSHARHVDCSIGSDVRKLRPLFAFGPLLPVLAMTHASAKAPPDSELVRRELLERLVERERPSHLVPVPLLGPPAAPSRTPSVLDCVSATYDITLAPSTGVTDAKLELTVRAVGKALPAINVAFDRGLQAGKVTATDHAATVDDAVYDATRVVRIGLDPPLAAGDETMITMPYAGTVACATGKSTAVACSTGTSFSFFASQSIFPFIFDPDVPADSTFDGLTRRIVLRVPAESDVVVTGQKVSETINQGQKVSTWSIDKSLSRTTGVYALVGKLGQKVVDGRSPTATFVFPPPEQEIDRDLTLWSETALDFVEKTSGRALPFDRGLSLVRLPKSYGDPGTATFGMTLLSDSYSRMGPILYEETWAHENAHLFWGIVVPETNAKESRLMTEGMATLTELEYTYARHFSDRDHDAYLARRFVPIMLDVRAHAEVPPIQVGPEAELTDDFRGPTYMLWAYYQTAATLDHLRVTLGDDVFTDVIADYRDQCSYVGCSPDALRDLATKRSGKDMAPFFARWITARERPRVALGFTPAGDGADVELTQDDDRPLTLELWIELEDGSREKRRVDFVGRTAKTHLEVPGGVRSISASPRHDALVDVRSSVEGDLDFDGETDGFDILRCAQHDSETYTSRGATGLWNVDEPFDPRCDLDGNGVIDDADFGALTAQFGKLRPR